MATPAQRAKAAIKKAKKEIGQLKGHIKKGTLHRNRLNSGLKNLTKIVTSIPPHKPSGPGS
jgi:hypothetical protein